MLARCSSCRPTSSGPVRKAMRFQKRPILDDVAYSPNANYSASNGKTLTRRSAPPSPEGRGTHLYMTAKIKPTPHKRSGHPCPYGSGQHDSCLQLSINLSCNAQELNSSSYRTTKRETSVPPAMTAPYG